MTETLENIVSRIRFALKTGREVQSPANREFQLKIAREGVALLREAVARLEAEVVDLEKHVRQASLFGERRSKR
jgi:hypothetical protein